MEKGKIDNYFYSRQIATIGLDVMKKLSKMKVLIFGMRGIGTEIAKNIILSGIDTLYISDDSPFQIEDLSSNFFSNEKDLGKTRSMAVYEGLKNLNPSVNLKIKGENELFDLKNLEEISIIIISEFVNKKDLQRIDEYCRKNNKGFILTLINGLFPIVFVDFGHDFLIENINGKEPFMFLIEDIKCSNPCIITLREKENLHLKPCKVKFNNVNGTTELNSLSEQQITIESPFSFSIDIDATNYGEFSNYGEVIEYIKPVRLNHLNFIDSLNNCSILDYNYLQENSHENIHLCLLALFEFYEINKRLPKKNDDEDSLQFYSICETINERMNFDFSLEKDLIYLFSKKLLCEISPICTTVGGLVSQEVIKFLGKYEPISQFLRLDFSHISSKNIHNLSDKNYALNGRYADYNDIYGVEFYKKIKDLKVFIVGVGALGCEYLKILSLMGVSTGEKGRIYITDADKIEISNLNRQFLFDKTSIGLYKSTIAAKRISSNIENLKITPFNLYCSVETENVFDDSFWEELDLIIMAVDNVKARLYLDSKVVNYGIKSIEAGIEALRGNTKCIIPFLTQSYSDNPGIETQDVPSCTLRNIPSRPEHCIKYAQELIYHEYFEENIKSYLSFVQSFDDFNIKLKEISCNEQKFNKLKTVADLVRIKLSRQPLRKLLEFTMNVYRNHFDEDFVKNKELDFIDTMKCTQIFIMNFSKLLSYLLNLKVEINSENISRTIKDIKSKNNETNEKSDLNEKIMKLIKELQSNYKENYDKLIDINVETNPNSQCLVLDIIHSSARLKAAKHNLPKFKKIKTLITFQKISPTVIQSACTVTGLGTSQIPKLMQGNTNRIFNFFFNSGVNAINYYNPQEVKEIVESPSQKPLFEGLTKWHTVEIQGPMTFTMIKNYLFEKYHVKINSIQTHSNAILYSSRPVYKKFSDILVEERYMEYFKLKYFPKYIFIDILCFKDDKEIVFPKIKYILNN